MKKTIFLILALFCLLPTAHADDLPTLWKQYHQAQRNDLPRTQLSLARKIEAQAVREKRYGDLLAAQIFQVQIAVNLSRDSLMPALRHLQAKAATTKDPVVKAIYHCAIYKLCDDNYDYRNRVDQKAIQDSSARLAMLHPELLAREKSRVYEPLFNRGYDDDIFQHDLLHAIGFTIGSYDAMRQYYESVGNRNAACICALYAVTQGNTMPANLMAGKLDSLKRAYADVPAACEVAIAQYSNIDNDIINKAQRWTNVTDALSRWGSWRNAELLKAAQEDLTTPDFHLSVPTRVPSGREFFIQFDDLCNIHRLDVTVARLAIPAEKLWDKYFYDTDQPLIRNARRQTVFTTTKAYTPAHPYDEWRDSVSIRGLKPGIYILTAKADRSKDMTVSTVFIVSDVALLCQPLPHDDDRIDVLDATTGQPLPGAKVEDVGGEYYAYTDDDRYGDCCQFCDTDNDDGTDSYTASEVYTDRAIYRPGQSVHASAIFYNADNSHPRPLSGKKVQLIMTNADWQEVAIRDTVTDAYGTAAADFILPDSVFTGQFMIRASEGGGNAVFSVEEYKRPTFELTLQKPTGQYVPGDTLCLSGTARGYNGVGLDSAMVVCTTQCERAWWYREGNDITRQRTDTITTSQQGLFTLPIPLTLMQDSDRRATYYYTITTKATSRDGETHEQQLTVPVAWRTTRLTTNAPEKVIVGKLANSTDRKVTFTLTNLMQAAQQGTIAYRFDQQPWLSAEANTPAQIFKGANLTIGCHTLEAVYAGDTLRHAFTVYDLSSTRPAKGTRDWFLQSADRFPTDGSPVYVQIGSSDAGVHILCTITAEDSLLERSTLDLSDTIVTRAFTYRPEYGNGIVVNYAWIKDGQFFEHLAYIVRPETSKQLHLSWKTFRDRVRPGKQEQWTLTIQDSESHPARAQLMATLYDKSLDQLRPHDWQFFLRNYDPVLKTYDWQTNITEADSTFSWLNDGNYSFYYFNLDLSTLQLRYNPSTLSSTETRFTAPTIKKDEEVKPEEEQKAQDERQTPRHRQSNTTENKVFDVVEQMPSFGSPGSKSLGEETQLRRNLQETAFFYPSLQSDTAGEVSLRFTLPESVTSWRMLGLAHDTTMCYGSIEATTVAQKELMVEPNLPRFLRQGDQAIVRATVSNLTAKKLKGCAMLLLLNAKTEQPVWSAKHKFKLAANSQSTIAFALDADRLAPADYIVRIIAEAGDYSDGEQHELSILSRRERVTNTLAFTLDTIGTTTIDLQRLIPSKGHDPKLSMEYTANPAWLIVEALPTLSDPGNRSAIDVAAALYANSIVKALHDAHPEFSIAIDTLHDVDYYLSKNIHDLRDLQQSGGGWGWFRGMKSSKLVTGAVATMLTRLKCILPDGLDAHTGMMLSNALFFMKENIHKEVAEMRKQHNSIPSEFVLHYLYLTALDSTYRAWDEEVADRAFLLRCLASMPRDLTIYGKARAAVIFARNGMPKEAQMFLQSAEEYAVETKEMGRYYDTPKAFYSWRDYRIPTEVAVMEAHALLRPDDAKTMQAMRRWLLQEKRTQLWDTPLNTVDAASVFLKEITTLPAPNDTAATILVDGKPLTGKQQELPAAAHTLSITKHNTSLSWGAVYASALQDVDTIATRADGITVRRELFSADGTALTTEPHVGDKVMIRITVTADRDYDLVTVTDHRAACLEPVSQRSGLNGSYYEAPRDNETLYFFDQLAKGTHTMQTLYYVDRKGNYQSGSCTAECTYAPAYCGRAEALKIIILPL